MTRPVTETPRGKPVEEDYAADAKMVRLCADAMGIKPDERTVRNVNYGYALAMMGYNPIKNDKQAMALVKKFGISIRKTDPDWWDAWLPLQPVDGGSPDLNRAIVLCVASMQFQKEETQ